MEGTPPTEGGIFSSVARLIKTLRDVLENRFELFLVELKEERIRFFEAMCLLVMGAICALMTLIMVTLIIVAIFWDTHRMLVMILIAVAYVISTAVAFVKLRNQLLHWQALPATLEQIKQDRSCLEK